MEPSLETWCATPSGEHFDRLLTWLEALEPSAFDQACRDVELRLRHWKPSERALPSRWSKALLSGGALPRALSLVRSCGLLGVRLGAEELASLEASGLLRHVWLLKIRLVGEHSWIREAPSIGQKLARILRAAAHGQVRELELHGMALDAEALAPLADGSAWIHLRLLRCASKGLDDDTMKTIASFGAFANLEEVWFSEQPFTVLGLQAWLDGGPRTRLRTLFCDTSALGPKGDVSLRLNGDFVDLETLVVSGCALTEGGAGPLLAALPCAHLRTLTLSANGLGAGNARQLAANPALGTLEHLCLSSNDLRSGGLQALASSGHLTNLRTLELGGTGLDDEGLHALAASPLLGPVETLDLSQNPITGVGLGAVLTSPHAGSLRELVLFSTRIGDEGAAALAAWPALVHSAELSLGGVHLGSAGLAALAASPHTGGICLLRLWRNHVGTAGIEALGKTAYFPALQQLYLEENNLDDEAIAILFSSPLMERLVRLEVSGNRFGADGLTALLRSPRVRSLKYLGLFGISLGDKENELHNWAYQRDIELGLPVENPYDT